MSYLYVPLRRYFGCSQSFFNKPLHSLPLFLPSSSTAYPQFLPCKCTVMADHFGGIIPSADDGHSETKTIYGAVITVTILATIAVIFRFVARKKSEAAISYDDYSILLALVNIPSLTYAYDVDKISDCFIRSSSTASI